MKTLVTLLILTLTSVPTFAENNQPNDTPTLNVSCKSIDGLSSISFEADGDIADVKLADKKQGDYEFLLKDSTDDSYNLSISNHLKDKVLELIIHNRRLPNAAYVHLELWALPATVKATRKEKYTVYYSFQAALQGTPDGVFITNPDGSEGFAHWYQRTVFKCTAEDNL